MVAEQQSCIDRLLQNWLPAAKPLGDWILGADCASIGVANKPLYLSFTTGLYGNLKIL